MRASTLLWELTGLRPGSFQQACGFEYTSKLQRMFQDIGVSKDLNEQFKKHLTNSEPLDCEYRAPAAPARAGLCWGPCPREQAGEVADRESGGSFTGTSGTANKQSLPVLCYPRAPCDVRDATAGLGSLCPGLC